MEGGHRYRAAVSPDVERFGAEDGVVRLWVGFLECWHTWSLGPGFAGWQVERE